MSDGPSIQNHRITKTYFRTCSTCLSRSQARFCLYTLRPISDRAERTFVLPPLLFRRRPPQSNCPPYTVLDPDYGPELEPQACQGGISRMAPRELASTLQSLPPILHKQAQSPVQSYSKGSRGLSAQPRIHCIFTAISISLSLGWRQRRHRYAIRAGRNLPDKEFRYLRTRYSYGRRLPGLRSRASLALTPSINLPAPGRRHTLYVHFRVCRVLCF